NLQANTAYNLYFAVRDSTGNSSTVGSVSITTLVDSVKPALSAISGSVLDTTAELQFTTSEPGITYYLAQQGGSVPTEAQVKSGSGNGGAIVNAGSLAVNTGPVTLNFSGLSLQTSYTLYAVVEDPSANISNIASFSATTSGDVTGPAAVITFPTAYSMIEAESSTTVYGTSSDLFNTVTSVKVNGVDAVTSDNFANWSVSVPLSTGVNTLQVTTVDSLNNTNDNAADVEVLSIPISLAKPEGMAIDKANDKVFIIDLEQRALVSVDLTSGTKSIVSSQTRGSGTAFNSPITLDIDTGINHAYVLDGNTIIDVDLATGDRTVLSDATTGTGPVLSNIIDLTIDTANRLLYVLSNVTVMVDSIPRVYNSVLSVDLDTGNREIFDPASTGDALNLSLPRGILLAGTSLYISHFSGQDGLIDAINITDGSYRVVSTNGFGFGVSMPYVENMTSYFGSIFITQYSKFNYLEVESSGDRRAIEHSSFPATRKYDLLGLTDIVADQGNDRLLVIDSELDAVVAVEYDYLWQSGRGAQTMISRDGIGQGKFIFDPSSIELDSNNNQLIIADKSSDRFTARRLYRVDLNTSDRISLGNSLSLVRINDFKIDSANDRVFVLYTDDIISSNEVRALFEVDLVTGDRILVSNGGAGNIDVPVKGAGDTFNTATSLVLDIDNNRALVSSLSTRAVIAVDLDTGDRTIFSQFSSSTGTGIDTFPDHMILDKINDRILGVDSVLAAVVAIDLTTGDRSIISDGSTGTGDVLTTPNKIALDSSNNRVFVLSNAADIVEVDLANGNRSVISNSSVGTGVTFQAPSSLAIDIDNNRLFVGDSSRDAIFAVQIDSGNRVIMAK
ncbi:MAG: hypothetical protein KAU21_20860, partial [Gammaproteobacteria bacterium]|nr:hypothetical protein [Gammaproteobacteria bacterium]